MMQDEGIKGMEVTSSCLGLQLYLIAYSHQNYEIIGTIQLMMHQQKRNQIAAINFEKRDASIERQV